jgi:hypothetical protein
MNYIFFCPSDFSAWHGMLELMMMNFIINGANDSRASEPRRADFVRLITDIGTVSVIRFLFNTWSILNFVKNSLTLRLISGLQSLGPDAVCSGI